MADLKDIPVFNLSGVKVSKKAGKSAWSEASSDQKNSWVKSIIEFCLQNKSYSTAYALTTDVWHILNLNGVFINNQEDYTTFIDRNPGVTEVAKQILKEKQPASGSGSSDKVEGKNVSETKERFDDDFLIIAIVVSAVILIVAFWYLFKK